MSRFEYLRLADAVAAEIANGALKPGDRLPPQRSFAYERKMPPRPRARLHRIAPPGSCGWRVGPAPSFRRSTARITDPGRTARRGASIWNQLSGAADAGGADRQKPRRSRPPENLEVALRQATSTARRPRETFRQNSSPDKTGRRTPEQIVFTATAGNALPRPWPRCAAGGRAASRR